MQNTTHKIVNDPINADFFNATPLFGDVAYSADFAKGEFTVILPADEENEIPSRVAVYELKNKGVIGKFLRRDNIK